MFGLVIPRRKSRFHDTSPFLHSNGYLSAIAASYDIPGARINCNFSGLRKKPRAVPGTSMWEMAVLIWAPGPAVLKSSSYHDWRNLVYLPWIRYDRTNGISTYSTMKRGFLWVALSLLSMVYGYTSPGRSMRSYTLCLYHLKEKRAPPVHRWQTFHSISNLERFLNPLQASPRKIHLSISHHGNTPS